MATPHAHTNQTPNNPAKSSSTSLLYTRGLFVPSGGRSVFECFLANLKNCLQAQSFAGHRDGKPAPRPDMCPQAAKFLGQAWEKSLVDWRILEPSMLPHMISNNQLSMALGWRSCATPCSRSATLCLLLKVSSPSSSIYTDSSGGRSSHRKLQIAAATYQVFDLDPHQAPAGAWHFCHLARTKKGARGPVVQKLPRKHNANCPIRSKIESTGRTCSPPKSSQGTRNSHAAPQKTH